MTLRQHHTQKIAAAKAGFSVSTGARIERDPRPPSQKRRERRHGGGKPDPLAGLWDEEIVPLIEATPGLRPIAVLEEMQYRHPDRDLSSARRTLERRMRLWRAEHEPDREVIFRQSHPPGREGMSDFFDARARRHDCRSALGVSDLSLHPGSLGLGACRGGAWRRELHRLGWRIAERPMASRRCPARTSDGQLVGRLRQSRSGCPRVSVIK